MNSSTAAIWGLPANCPRCEGSLAHVNGCLPSPTLAVAVVYCGSCFHEFDITVRLNDRGYVQAKNRPVAA